MLRCSSVVCEMRENVRAAVVPQVSESSAHVHNLASNIPVLKHKHFLKAAPLTTILETIL